MAKHAPNRNAATEAPETVGEAELATDMTPAELLSALDAANGQVAQLQGQLLDADARVVAAEEKMRQYATALDKARTEFNAARERQAREYERNMKRDQTKAVSGLLTVLDTLDRSLQSANGGQVGESFVEGVRMIRNQFEAALATMGLQRFDGVGETFDPARHEAVTTMPVVDPSQDGKVIHSVAAGCLFGDEVVRPASVVVGKSMA